MVHQGTGRRYWIVCAHHKPGGSDDDFGDLRTIDFVGGDLDQSVLSDAVGTTRFANCPAQRGQLRDGEAPVVRADDQLRLGEDSL